METVFVFPFFSVTFALIVTVPLFFGLIASVGVTYLIYLSLRNQMILDFYIPWYSVVIAVFSVFFVVFCTMLYAMRKIQKDNVAETLKSDVF